MPEWFVHLCLHFHLERLLSVTDNRWGKRRENIKLLSQNNIKECEHLKTCRNKSLGSASSLLQSRNELASSFLSYTPILLSSQILLTLPHFPLHQITHLYWSALVGRLTAADKAGNNPTQTAGTTLGAQLGARKCYPTITYLIVQWAQVLETRKTSVSHANSNCDADN